MECLTLCAWRRSCGTETLHIVMMKKIDLAVCFANTRKMFMQDLTCGRYVSWHGTNWERVETVSSFHSYVSCVPRSPAKRRGIKEQIIITGGLDLPDMSSLCVWSIGYIWSIGNNRPLEYIQSECYATGVKRKVVVLDLSTVCSASHWCVQWYTSRNCGKRKAATMWLYKA